MNLPIEFGEKVVRTICPPHCHMACGILAHVKNDRLVKLEPASFPDARFDRICLKGLSQIEQVYHPDRLKHPMKRIGKRGEGKWQRISWDEAFDIMPAKLKEVIERYGSTGVAWFKGAGTFGRLTDSPKRLASLIHGTLIGEGMTDGIDCAGPQASVDTFGTAWWASADAKHFFGGSNEVADCLNSKLIVIWGANFADTAPHNMRFIFDAMERGARLVVIDPRFSKTASKADQWIPIRPGTDGCLALSMIGVIVEEGLCDEAFISNHTVGAFLVRSDNRRFLRENDLETGASDKYVVWDTSERKARTYDASTTPALTGTYTVNGIECKPAFQKLTELVAEYKPKKAEGITCVSADEIRRLAIDYATNKPATFGLMYGLDRWYYGNLSYRAILTLMAITGQVGISGGGFFLSDPTLGLSEDWWGFPDGKKPEFLNALDMYEAIPQEKPYPIKALWVYRGNFFRHSNAKRIISEILPALEFIVVADKFMTQTAEYADLVLPVCSSFETIDIHTGPFPHVQLQERAISPLHECKSDFEITAEVAKRMGFGKYFDKSPEEYIELLARLNGITLERLRREGAVPIDIPRPHVSFLDRKFPTPSGRVEFYVERCVEFGQELPVYFEPEEGTPQNPLARKYPLIFLQSHSIFHVHTSFANNQSLLELNPEPVLEINPIDAQKRDIRDGDLVIVFNDRGRVKLKARLNEAVRPGMVDTHWGWWANQFVEGSLQVLTKESINPALSIPNFSYFDCLVEVSRA